MGHTILVVDDDKDIVNLIAQQLSTNGYAVLKAYNGNQAIDIIKNQAIDLFICDIMMPDINGIEVCQVVRNHYATPIIFLSAKGEDSDIVYGLSAGADDYITKPFSSIVLLAKVSSMLRRKNVYNNSKHLIYVDDLLIDTQSCKVTKDSNNIRLTPKEFDILCLLASNKGTVYSISQIHDIVWGVKDIITENAIMVHIANLRSKIENDTKNPQYIKTVWGFGYKI